MSYPDPRYFGDQGEVSAKLRVAGAEPDLTIGSSTVMRYGNRCDHERALRLVQV